MEGIITANSPEVKKALEILDRAEIDIKYLNHNHKMVFKNERYFTSKELCEYLHINPKTLGEYRARFKIPYIDLGGKILYRETDIQKLMEDNYKALPERSYIFPVK